jgi:hypothetical protein
MLDNLHVEVVLHGYLQLILPGLQRHAALIRSAVKMPNFQRANLLITKIFGFNSDWGLKCVLRDPSRDSNTPAALITS